MSSSTPERRPCLGILPEQLGYVQCGFCTTILLVSVPTSCAAGGLQLKTVAVQCGNCTGVLSVTLPPRPTTPVVELPLQETGVDLPPRESEDESSGEDREVEAIEAENVIFPVVNKPPVRRQRTPSAYNCFIK
ncbi:hypothetical protein QOZ80_7BG0604860 [Eleusine coracana subsp. coracana]|nr:hypothetical protein QOZ80_7BG0604860 [Eleusine coracana subsp. coracana]